ncbi:MAG: site-specific integrase [Verrucomicrobia bacterium]|nr:site-specific integrase [Verrucomicrobiota bacterium]
MPKLAKIQSIQKITTPEGGAYFRVRFPAGVVSHRFQDGTVSRRTVYKVRKFTNERTARDFATDLRREHREAGEESHLISEGAKRALVLMVPKVRNRGESLESLLTDLSGALDALESLRDPNTGKAPRLLDAVQDYAKLIRPTLGTEATRDEVELYLDETDKRASTGNIQEDSARDTRNRLKRFLSSKLSLQPLGFFATDAGTKALEKWLDALPVGPTTFNNYRRHLSIFFGWAVKNSKLPRNPCAQIEERRKKRSEEQEAEIITPEEFRSLLLVARGSLAGVSEDERWSPGLLAGVALQGFCGIRAKEMTRLEWKAVDFEEGHVLVSKGQGKTRKGRLIPLPEVCRSWLKDVAGKTGPVVPNEYQKKVSGLRAIMRSPSQATRSAPGFVSSEMPDNCLRHSFATYHLALHKSEALTSRLMGNSPGVLRDNYEALVLRAPRLAPEWFKVKP